jgi:hypothetical protein
MAKNGKPNILTPLDSLQNVGAKLAFTRTSQNRHRK